MPIEINPNRINTTTGTDARLRERRTTANNFVVPKRAHINIIPSPESLATMIRSAVNALRSGARWDRGTILNLLV